MASETILYTYQDAVEHVLDVYELERTARNVRMARRAVFNAYTRIVNVHRWSYLDRRLQVRTEASQTTGSITYDHTGGTYEREVTLSGATWPDSVEFGKIIIDSVRYDIATQESSTVITLTVDSNPGSDVAAGTSYIWFRSTYPLPIRFHRASPVVDIANSYAPSYVTPNVLLQYQSGNYSPSRPQWYTFQNEDEYYGGMSIKFAPPPSEARTYDFMAEVRPRQLRTENYSTGTVSCSAGSTTVTGSGTTFSADHVGCVIRFSSSATAPTSQFGTVDDGNNPYFAQRIIQSVSTTTSLTIDTQASADTALSGVAYTISDPIDIEAGPMWVYFQRLIEEEFAKLERHKDLETHVALSDRELIVAMGADHKNKDMGDSSSTMRFFYSDIADWAVIE